MRWERPCYVFLTASWLSCVGCGGTENDAPPGSGSEQVRGDAAAEESARKPATRTCRPEKSCKSVLTSVFTLEACCTEEVECGFDLTHPEDLRSSVLAAFGVPEDANAEERCVERSRYFLTFPSDAEERVATGRGEDLLVTRDCESSSMLSVSFAGCCLPNDRCGISTYLIHDTLAVLAEDPQAPFAQLECVSVAEMNRQLSESILAGFAHLPQTEGSCDYAALAARLPPRAEVD